MRTRDIMKGLTLASVLGLGAWGVLNVEVEEAEATGTASFALVHDPADVTAGVTCTDLFTVRKMLVTGGNDNGDTVRITTDSAAGYTCGSSNQSGAAYLFTGNMVSIPGSGMNEWQPYHAGIAWKTGGATINPGDHTTSLTLVDGCYIKDCTSGTCSDYDASTLKRHVGTSGNNNGYVCLGSATFI